MLRLIHCSFVFATAALALFPLVALACGIYIPREGDANIVQERALIHWHDGKEEIVLEMSVQSDAPEAAWILPVPSPATAQLGNAKLFEELQELTKPTERIEIRYSDSDGVGTGAPPGAVQVLSRQTLGPFEVSTLAADDAAALDQWLKENGYTFPDGLDEILQYYVEKNWYYVAIKLQPQEGPLTGQLDPIWLSFESDEIVYPMRAAGMGQGNLLLVLYVLADHRVQSVSLPSSANEQLSFAGWLEPKDLVPGSTLQPFVTQKQFLTKFETHLRDVSQVDADFTFVQAQNDDSFRDEIVRYEYREGSALTGWLRGLCPSAVMPLGLVLGVTLLQKKRVRSENANR